jgi:tetratricopeptide (TPR) repeat protein
MISKLASVSWILIMLSLVSACYGNTSEELIKQGWDLNQVDSYSEAAEIFDEAILLNSSSPEAWHGKGFALNGIGYEKNDANEFVEARRYFEEAIKCFEKAIQLNSSFAYAYLDMADSESCLDNYERSLELVDKAIEIDPNNADAIDVKGIIYDRMGDYDKALEMYRKAVTMDPECATAWFNICGLLKEQSKGYPESVAETDYACQKAAALYNAHKVY